MIVSQLTRVKAVLTIPRLWAIYHLPDRPAPICCCPFTTDRRSGFSVSDDGLRWIDFTTGERGDAIDFLQKILVVSRPEAYVEFFRLHRAVVAKKEAKNAS
jgi:DNA primase